MRTSWPCATGRMTSYLRDAIIRVVSQALNKYVEGVSAERAQLSIREGVLEFQSAKLREGIVPATVPLQLKRGEISLSLKVPWRNLGQEPVVVRVSRLTLELEPAGIPSSPEEKIALLDRWREARDSAVQAKAKALAAADATDKQNAGMIARLAKNALSNLEVHVNCSALLRVGVEVLEVGASLQLQTAPPEAESQFTALPHGDTNGDAQAGTLFKSFELKEVFVELNKTPLLGPLSLNTRISAVGSSVRLGISLVNTSFSGYLTQVPAFVGIAGSLSRTAKELSKEFPKERRMKMGDASDGDIEDDSHEEDSEVSGSEDFDDGATDESAEFERDFCEFLMIKLKGRELTNGQAGRLREIEDCAPMSWLAWHLYVCEKQIQEASKERKPWLAGFFRQNNGNKESEEHGVMQDIKGLLKELPEDPAPETVEVVFAVPTLDFVLKDKESRPGDSDIRGNITAEARGLEVRVKMKPQGSRREVIVNGELISAFLKFQDSPLFYLGSGALASEDEEEFKDVAGAAIDLHVEAHEEANLGWVVAVNLLAPPGGEEAAAAVAAFASSSKASSVVARTWPCEVHLAPWSIRRFLELYLEAVAAYRQGMPEEILGLPERQRGRGMSFSRTRSSVGFERLERPERPRTHTQGLVLATKSVKEVAVDAAREALPAMRLSVNICVCAPVVYWELPSSDIASFRLGQLRACSVLRDGPAPSPLVAAKPACTDELAFVAELTQISVTIVQKHVAKKEKSHPKVTRQPSKRGISCTGLQYIVFEQELLSARAVNEDGSANVKVKATAMRMRAGRELWRFVGQVQPTMDWAIEPIMKSNVVANRKSTMMSPSDSVTLKVFTRLDRSVSGLLNRAMSVRKSRSPSMRARRTSRPTLFESSQEDPPDPSPVRSDSPQTPQASFGAPGPRVPGLSTRATSGITETGEIAGPSLHHSFDEDSEEVLGAFLGIRERTPVAAASEPARSVGGKTSVVTNQASTPKSVTFSPERKGSGCEGVMIFESEASGEPWSGQRSKREEAKITVTVDVSGFELRIGDDESGAVLAADTLHVFKHGTEATAVLNSLMLQVVMAGRTLPLVSLAGGGEVRTGITDGDPWVELRSRPITIDWRPHCAPALLHIAKGVKEAWAEAQSRVEATLPLEEEGRGAIGESWRRWKKARMKQIVKQFRRVHREKDPTRDMTALEPKEGLLVEDRLPSQGEGEELSLGVRVCLESVQFNLWPMPVAGAHSDEGCPCVQAELRTVRLTLCLFKSWMIRGFADLQSFEAYLYKRLVLAPRRIAPRVVPVTPAANTRPTGYRSRMSSGFEGEEISESQPALPQHHLLSIGFLVGERTLVCASGAQLSLLFRYRDLDFVLAYVHAYILDVLADFREPPPGATNGTALESSGKSSRSDSVSSAADENAFRDFEDGEEDPGENDSSPDTSSGGLVYSLDIGCPILFIPTFKAVVTKPLEEALDVTQGGQLGASGGIEGTDDTYSMFDFGHLQLWNSLAEPDKPASVDVRFRGTSVASNADGRTRWVAKPSNDCGTRVAILNRRIELVSTGHYCMSLMRREVTQWLDLMAENILYKGYAPKPPADWPTSERKVLRDAKLLEAAQRAAAEAQNQGFAMEWQWEELDIDTSFTAAAPLSHIELCGGVAKLQVGAGFSMELQAQSFALLDRRTGSRNAEPDFIRCGVGQGGPGGRWPRGSAASVDTIGVANSLPMDFLSVTSSPAECRRGTSHSIVPEPFLFVSYGQRKAVIKIKESNTLVLPQLLLDQQTWGLSLWRLCTWSQPAPTPPNDRKASLLPHSSVSDVPNGVPEPPNEQPSLQPIVIQVSLEQGTFRLPTEYEDPAAEHLEIRGNLSVNVTLGPIMQLDINLTDGRFHRSKSETLICPAVSLLFKSTIEGTKTETGSQLTDFQFNLEMQPTRLQLTGLDLSILTNSFGQLARRDAESMEPREEIELRDPDAFRGDRGMNLVGVFDFKGMQLLLADDRRGAQPALSVEVRCSQLRLDMHSKENQPSRWSIKSPQEALVLDVRSFHSQLGVWEPVLSTWCIGLEFRQTVMEQHQGGRAALKRELTVASHKPLTATITTTFLRLMAWFGPLFSAHLKSKNPDESGFESPLCMLNLSGECCTVTRKDAVLRVWPGSDAVSLDGLLRPVGEEVADFPLPHAKSEQSARTDAATSPTDLLMELGSARRRLGTTSEDEVVQVSAEGWDPISVQLARESLFVPALGKLVCEVLIPHPSRRLLLLSSAACVVNRTRIPFEIRFLDRMGNQPVEVKGFEPISAALLGWTEKGSSETADEPLAPSSRSQNRDVGCESVDFGGFDRSHIVGRTTTASGSTCGNFLCSSVTVGPGQVFFAPFDALHGTSTEPMVHMQLRPAGGMNTWSTARTLGVGSSAKGPIEMGSEGLRGPAHTFFVEVDDRHCEHVELTTLRLTVWTRSLGNALPCELECRTRGASGVLAVSHFDEMAMPSDIAEFQVRLKTTEDWSDWSPWLRWQCQVAQKEDNTEDFVVYFKDRPIALCLVHDEDGRRNVIHAPFWFVDTTGLGAQLSVAGKQAVVCNWDDSTICLLPPIIKPGPDNCQIELALGGPEYVTTVVPTVGATESLKLPPHYAAVLRTERISAADMFGVHCRLVSLLPKYVLFNRTRYTIAFWQEGCNRKERVPPDENSTFSFEPHGRQRLIFAPVGSADPTFLQDFAFASPSFELEDHMIGAYPVSTQYGPMCLKISREGGVLTASVDVEGCHSIYNEHKSLIVEVRPDGDLKAAAVACPGQRKCFASRDPFEKGSIAEVFMTRLGSEPRTGTLMEKIKLDLRRRDRFEMRVGGLPVTVLVELTERMALITVRPRLGQEFIIERFDMHINLQSLSFALVTEAPRREVFGVRIEGIDLLIGKDNDEDMKTWAVTVDKLQVDRHQPTPDVVLASVQSPFLKWRILREDCNSSHTVLSSGDLTVGEMEASIDDATVEQLMKFVREAVIDPPGLRLVQVWQRTASTYSQSCRKPPDVPPTFCLRSLFVSSARLRIWARLNMVGSFLPRALVWFVRVTGLGVRTLQLDGVVISVPSLRFFQYECQFGRPDPPFVGSTGGLLSRLGKRYVPELAQCWQSVVSNSNIMFGGVLSRQFWLPKYRVVNTVLGTSCHIGSRGQVEPRYLDII